MLRRNYVWAGSTVILLTTAGLASTLFGACSPNGGGFDAGVDVQVCDPQSSDPAGCPCDPKVTPQVDCYSGPPGTSNKGICQVGTRKCTANGTWTACVGEVTPQPEVCNLADDDCNGISDDLFTDAAVLATCNSPACVPPYGDAGIKCWGPDPGICGAGVPTCGAGPKGGVTTCTEFIHTGAPEVCNGIDDDCNGTIDDGLDNEGPCDLDDGSVWPPDANPFEGGKPTKILGECLHGQLSCSNSGCGEHGCTDAGDICTPSQPAATETCNGKDDNCNGVVDEHSCTSSYDVQYGYTFCCNFGGSYYGCESSYYAQYYKCNDAGP
jgi:hypothetical protein